MDVLDFSRMRAADTSRPVYRFGSFELDPSTGELRKHGIRVRLQDQPLQILVLLLKHKGELVTREQIQEKLWTPGTYIDYDNAINSAMRRLRESLGDDHENPRFIETFARRGYRFIGILETPRDLNASATPEPNTQPVTEPRRRIRYFALSALVLLVIASVEVWWVLRSRQGGSATSLNSVPLTAAAGWESEPSFSPDGTQVAYVWDEGAGPDIQRHIFVKLIGGGAPLRLTSGPAQDRSPAWSPDGQSIAFVRVTGSLRSIYLMPALGGAERKIADGYFALRDLFTRRIAWSPDGQFLAAAEGTSANAPTFLSLIKVETGEKVRLTTPPEAKTSDMNPTFSLDGRKLLFTRCGEAKCGLYVLQLRETIESWEILFH